MAFEIIQGWKGFAAFTREQHHTVGMVGITPDGRRASYVEFQGGNSYNRGMLLDDIGTPGGNAPAPRASSDVGENILRGKSGDFSAFAWNDCVGAFGAIYDGDGENQYFVVKRMGETAGDLVIDRWGVPEDTERSKGWTTGLTTDSRFSLRLPGRVTGPAATAGPGYIFRGVIQADLAVPANEFRYGWVLQAGVGWGRVGAGDE